MVPHPHVLACPETHAPLTAGDGALVGPGGARYPITDGLVDFCPTIAVRSGLAQQAMESPVVVRRYEAQLRPTLTRLVGGPSYADEAAYLWQHLGDPGGVVLDLACGTGRYTRLLAERLGAERVIGLDLSRPMLQEARRTAPDLTFVRGSAVALPIATGALSAVVSFGALHLFPDPGAALAEIGRCLSADGRLICLTACSPGGALRVVQDSLGRAIRLRFLSLETIADGLNRGGLVLSDLTRFGRMAMFRAQRR